MALNRMDDDAVVRWAEDSREGSFDASTVLAGLTTRVGFPAAGTGDDDEASRARARGILAKVLEKAGRPTVPADHFAWMRQVHGHRVFEVTSAGFQGEGDALVTVDPTFVLLISVADCGPVLIWDPNGPAFGALHAGWRGAVDGVVEATVQRLVELGARASHLMAWVGPCIGPAHFEVGPEVAAQFDAREVLPAGSDGRARPHVNLPSAIRNRLRRAGLAEDRIASSGDCTFAREDLYWSYRRDGGIAGRQLGFVTRR